MKKFKVDNSCSLSIVRFVSVNAAYKSFSKKQCCLLWDIKVVECSSFNFIVNFFVWPFYLIIHLITLIVGTVLTVLISSVGWLLSPVLLWYFCISCIVVENRPVFMLTCLNYAIKLRVCRYWLGLLVFCTQTQA